MSLCMCDGTNLDDQHHCLFEHVARLACQGGQQHSQDRPADDLLVVHVARVAEQALEVAQYLNVRKKIYHYIHPHLYSYAQTLLD